METKNKHWTHDNADALTCRIASDFIGQLETKMEQQEITGSQLAKALDVTDGRVSQVLNNPGNLTLRNMVEYSHALGMKVSVVAYDDGDPQNELGPINAVVFSKCWEKAGKPRDIFLFEQAPAVQVVDFVYHVYRMLEPENQRRPAENSYYLDLTRIGAPSPKVGTRETVVYPTSLVARETERIHA